VVLQILDIVLHALFEIREREEIDGLDHFSGSRVLSLELDLELLGREREHPAVRVVNDGNFASPEQLLGDDDTAEGFLSVVQMRQSTGDGVSLGTYAAPPGNNVSQTKITSKPLKGVRTGITNDMCVSLVDAEGGRRAEGQ
jgi:hypothetical protein